MSMLLNCPLCQSENIQTMEPFFDSDDVICMCINCGCKAPETSWNTRTQSQWISVEVRLPEFTVSFGGFALVSDDVVAHSVSKGNIFADYSNHGWTSEDGDILDDVIEWLPIPPKAGE